jgi:hypothetical protein
MINQDVIDLYSRVPDGAKVIVMTRDGQMPTRLSLPPPAPKPAVAKAAPAPAPVPAVVPMLPVITMPQTAPVVLPAPPVVPDPVI